MRRMLLAVFATFAVVVFASVAGASPFSSKAFPSNKNPLFALLKGTNEVKSATAPHGGDPDARGSATVLVARSANTLCFGITLRGTDTPILAHIHKGPAGVNGPVVIPLTPPTSGDPGASSGCVTADPALLKDIQLHPSEYYVNVHTTAFPAGAARGQLFVAPAG
jgi:hypothetical protein